MSDSMSRRRFLGIAVVGGVAAGIAARSWAAEDAPSRKIVVGVMGMGGRGTELAQQFQRQPGCEVAYVCCADKNRLAAAAKAVARASRAASRRRSAISAASSTTVGRRAGLRRARPLARAGHDPGLRGRQARLRREARCHNPHEGELQVAAAPKAQPRRPGGHPAPQLRRASSRRSQRAARRRDRPGALLARLVQQPPRRRSATASPRPCPMARLRPLARPGAAAAVSQQRGPLQLALVLALGHRRARQQRRPRARLLPLGPGRRFSHAGSPRAAATTVSTTTRKRPTPTS